MARQVFVAGATGYMGRHLLPVLLARGHRVRALARRGSEAKVPRGCEIMVGDPFDRQTFASTIPPCDTFVQLVGVPHPSPREGARRLGLVTLSQMIEALVRAIEDPPARERIVEVPEIRKAQIT